MTKIEVITAQEHRDEQRRTYLKERFGIEIPPAPPPYRPIDIKAVGKEAARTGLTVTAIVMAPVVIITMLALWLLPDGSPGLVGVLIPEVMALFVFPFIKPLVNWLSERKERRASWQR